ncbi:MAG: hypothetical protein IJ277_08145 [Bacteroidaceae bacterium]|nr:hypothetical protein [Bacteroidaceae bacterium]
MVEFISNSRYIKNIKLNGEDYHLPYIMHSDIAQEGKLTVEMSSTPVAP